MDASLTRTHQNAMPIERNEPESEGSENQDRESEDPESEGKCSPVCPHAAEHEFRARKLIAKGDADGAAIHHLLATNMVDPK